MTSYSSSKIQSSLKRVNCKNAIELIRIIDRYTSKDVDFISKRYSDKYRFFTDTLQFLVDIGWVISKGGMVRLDKSIPSHVINGKIDKVLHEVIFAMMVAKSSISKPLLKYISGFSLDKYRISCVIPHRLSPDIITIRDMLLESGLMELDRRQEKYFINDEFSYIYFQAKNLISPKSSESIFSKHRSNTEIGFFAEEIILQYEVRRLDDPNIKIVHVSADNPFSCFDIHSYTIEKTERIDRFIEVKAVSSTDFSFYWSKSERDAASILSDKYFLYLLPVIGSSDFDINNLRIIQNPYFTLFQNQEVWAIEESILRCFLR